MSDLPMKSYAADAADKALHADIAALIKRHLIPDTPERALAVASQVVGQVLALQDQRYMTKAMAFDVVLSNIEIGNQSVIGNLINSKGPQQ
jgi:hypothetical protein